MMMNYPENASNRVHLAGNIITEPVFSHEIYGEGFYEMKIRVPRLSEQSDILPITVSERLISEKTLEVGSNIALNGQFRSYNKLVDGRSRLMLTVFVREIVDCEPDSNPNAIELCGFVCKAPVYRTTPFKREICDILLAVNRAYNKSDYIPCIAWGRNARFVKNIGVGERITVMGRVQSRQYQKKITETESEVREAYEISVNKIIVESGLPKSKAAYPGVEDSVGAIIFGGVNQE